MSSSTLQRPTRSSRSRKRSRAPLAILSLLVILALTAGVSGWYMLLRPDRPSIAAGQSVEIVIDSGTSTADIGSTLSSAGVVDNALMFRLKARNSDVAGQLKAGTYAFVTGSGYEDVLAKLNKGPDIVYFDIVIPEGFTIRQIAARFAKQAGVDEDEMFTLVSTGAEQFAGEHPYLEGAYGGSLEGFLFPATYRIKEGTTPEQIVGQMLDAFDDASAKLDLTFAESKNLTLPDIVTIASIIEREVRLKKEYPLVSSVVYNRLKIRIKLQLDSTVFYGLPEGTKILRKEDLQNGYPHNTYSIAGLPAGPIGNPGLEALEAAAHPAETKYLYYVLTGDDGSQTFATNYDDFLKAVAIYREKFVNK
ncbi:MAG: endolytic transglycosylase MltG [Coriobacteriia bacterium]|nr:endolytic transglycosylase MltG [Coriobacteriia bacterium]